jgi:hypothetical protein
MTICCSVSNDGEVLASTDSAIVPHIESNGKAGFDNQRFVGYSGQDFDHTLSCVIAAYQVQM